MCTFAHGHISHHIIQCILLSIPQLYNHLNLVSKNLSEKKPFVAMNCASSWTLIVEHIPPIVYAYN